MCTAHNKSEGFFLHNPKLQPHCLSFIASAVMFWGTVFDFSPHRKEEPDTATVGSETCLIVGKYTVSCSLLILMLRKGKELAARLSSAMRKV